MQRKKLTLALVVAALMSLSILSISVAAQSRQAAEQRAVNQQLAALVGGNFAINWDTYGGLGEMSSANFAVHSTVGQPVIGTFSSPSYEVHNGFWQTFIDKFYSFLPLILKEVSGG